MPCLKRDGATHAVGDFPGPIGFLLPITFFTGQREDRQVKFVVQELLEALLVLRMRPGNANYLGPDLTRMVQTPQ